jgi:RNA polymerase primary sigma factor
MHNHEQGDDALAMYIAELRTVKPLTHEEETRLFGQLTGRGDRDEARELIARRIIEGHLAQVVSIAQEYSASGVPLLDLIQEGNIGLMTAVKSFAESPIGDFSDYAASCIRDSIKEAFE